MQLKLKHVKGDITAKVGGMYLAQSLDFELFTLEQMFEEAECRQSMDLAGKALKYAQNVIYQADNYPRPKYAKVKQVAS